MKTITATDARTDLFSIVKDAVKGHKQYTITSKEGRAVLISEEEYESLIETLELLSQPRLRESIAKSMKQVEKGETYSMDEIFGKKKK